MTFGEFLCEKRKEKNLTQKQLAEMLYVSVSAVSKWEKNVARPDIELLPRLSDILSVTEHELITASVDERSRQTEKQAKKWRKLTFSWNLFFFIAYGVTLFVCFLVDLVTDGRLDWFFIVFSALLLAATFTTLPQYIKAYRLLLIPLSEFLALALLLFLIERLSGGKWFLLAITPVFFGAVAVFLPLCLHFYGAPAIKRHAALFCVGIDFLLLVLMMIVIEKTTGGSWFLPLALPLTAGGFLLTIAVVLVLRYLKTNRLLKAGLCLSFFTGAYLAAGYGVKPLLSSVGLIAEKITEFSPFSVNFAVWTNEYVNYNVTFLLFLLLALLSILFLASGIVFRFRSITRKSDK